MAFSTTPSEGADRLRATADNQTINALGGNDWIRSTFSGSTLYGGLGHDRISVEVTLLEPLPKDSNRVGWLYGGNGNDWLETKVTGPVAEGANFQPNVYLYGGNGNDNLYAQAIFTADNPNVIGEYFTYLDGGSGSDNIWIENSGLGGWAKNFVEGGNGNDIVYIFSTAGEFVSSAGSENEVEGGSGDDDITVYSRGGDNYLRGGEGNDSIFAIIEDDFGFFPPGNNYILGGEGDDIIEATLQAEYGFSQIHGDDGDDFLVATGVVTGTGPSALANIAYGGNGNDTIHVDGTSYSSTGGISNRAYGEAGDDQITSIIYIGGDNTEDATGNAEAFIYGGNDNDTIIATTSFGVGVEAAGGASLFGGNGNDILRVNGGIENLLDGGAGDDTITGGSGNDRIIGGSGADTLRSGGGEDAFVYLWTTGVNVATRDTIRGFGFGDDVIDLSAIDANANRGGNQAFIFGGGTGVGRVWVEDNATGTGSVIRANAGGAEQLYINVEDGTGRDASDWSADDFLL